MCPVHTVATVTAGFRCPPLMLAVIYTAGHAMFVQIRHYYPLAWHVTTEGYPALPATAKLRPFAQAAYSDGAELL